MDSPFARPDWTVRAAGELVCADIGSQVRIRTWNEDTEIETIRTGELRQISYDGSQAFLHFGNMAAREVALNHDHPVMLDPPLHHEQDTLLVYVPTKEDQ